MVELDRHQPMSYTGLIHAGTGDTGVLGTRINLYDNSRNLTLFYFFIHQSNHERSQVVDSGSSGLK
jgi:hypothetical protein